MKKLGENLCLLTGKKCRKSFKAIKTKRGVNPYFCADCKVNKIGR